MVWLHMEVHTDVLIDMSRKQNLHAMDTGGYMETESMIKA